MKPYQIRINYQKTKPQQIVILEKSSFSVSWAVSAEENQHQTGYHLSLIDDTAVIWDKKVISEEQMAFFDGPALPSGMTMTLSISLFDKDGRETDAVEVRICNGEIPEWRGQWLCSSEEKECEVLDFIYDFTLQKKVKSACLFVCGLGYHKVELNGFKVFDQPMNPAYSEYEKRTYYSVLPEFQKYLVSGENRIGIRTASGWRNPKSICYNLVNRIAAYTGKTQMSAMLRIDYEDGATEWICSGEGWSYRLDPITYSDIFMGETFEASGRIPEWSQAGVILEDLRTPALTEPPCSLLMPQTMADVKRQEVYQAQTVSEIEPGIWAIDFGQNLAGVCRVRIPRGIAKGTEIVIHQIEFLDENGRLFLPQLRNAASVDKYIASGDEKDLEWWEPEFTYHGFRYAEITGYPGPLTREDVEAVSFYTDIKNSSFFTCGSGLVNQIYKNCIQTEKANIHSLLTDCPQRDERMGWMNDATVRFEGTPYAFDVGGIFPKVVRDNCDTQEEDGSITCTAPYAFGTRPADPVCSAFLIAGWQSYLTTGNIEIIKEAYPYYKKWNDFLESHSPDGIVDYSYYGDWAGPAYACVNDEFACSAVTPGLLMSTGFHYLNAKLLSQMAELLGMHEEARNQKARAEFVQAAFLKKWWHEDTGKVDEGSEASQAFALWLKILPENGREKAARVLREDLISKEYRFTTGNLCTRYMMEVLADYGYIDDAWEILNREEYPSMGYMIQNEATTIWERYELKKNCIMNSHNHPMHGSIYRFLYSRIAGIESTGKGWESFTVKPSIPEKLLSAQCLVDTPYGDIVLRWVKRYGALHIYLTVPYGTQANVTLPWGENCSLGKGFYHWETNLDYSVIG